jgi:hypothetical protein
MAKGYARVLDNMSIITPTSEGAVDTPATFDHKGHQDTGGERLLMMPNPSKAFECWVAADYGCIRSSWVTEDLNTVKGRIGHIISYPGVPPAWTYRLPTVFFFNKSEVEFVSLSTALRNAIPLDLLVVMVVTDFQMRSKSTELNEFIEDNSGALKQARVAKYRPPTRHIRAVRYNSADQHKVATRRRFHQASIFGGLRPLSQAHLWLIHCGLSERRSERILGFAQVHSRGRPFMTEDSPHPSNPALSPGSSANDSPFSISAQALCQSIALSRSLSTTDTILTVPLCKRSLIQRWAIQYLGRKGDRRATRSATGATTDLDG